MVVNWHLQYTICKYHMLHDYWDLMAVEVKFLFINVLFDILKVKIFFNTSPILYIVTPYTCRNLK